MLSKAYDNFKAIFVSVKYVYIYTYLDNNVFSYAF